MDDLNTKMKRQKTARLRRATLKVHVNWVVLDLIAALLLY